MSDAQKQILGTKQKALAINLDPRTYGTFAEIGAGQEVAANFFKAGAASQTIAKTMSAYDMTFSDAIYGPEESGRYVVQSRLNKMLTKEYSLLEIRLNEKRGANSLFFAYANTVATINFRKDNQGHGWMGVKFQLTPFAGPNECVIHFKLLDNDAILQQNAVGILGVNLIYGCFYRNGQPEDIITTLLEDLGRDRVEVDMFRLTGPDFDHFDNRLFALLLVKNKMTRSALFGPDGKVLQASDVFYKKNILAYRGRFRPFTLLNQDMYLKGIETFKKNLPNPDEDLVTVAELTLFNLTQGGEMSQIDYTDFLHRVDILCSLGYTVLVSDYQGYYRLASYLQQFTNKKIGIILGVVNLDSIFKSDLYKKLKGGMLEAFGMLFGGQAQLLVYPMLDKQGRLVNTHNYHLPTEGQEHIYQYLLGSDKITDIASPNTEFLNIWSEQLFEQIQTGKEGWEKFVPEEVADAIKSKGLFGWKSLQ